MTDVADACLYGRLNLFLQGDTGSGKTQLARDVMSYFGSSSGDSDFAQRVSEEFEDGLDYKAKEAISEFLLGSE